MKLSTAITRLIDRLYLPFVAKLIPAPIFRYGICGGFNTFVVSPLVYFLIYNYVVHGRFFDLCWVVMSPHIAAQMIEFPIVSFTGFWLNKYVAFRNSTVRTTMQIAFYCMSIGVSLLIGYLCMKLFVEIVNMPAPLAKYPSNLITALTSYLIQRHLTFRGSTN